MVFDMSTYEIKYIHPRSGKITVTDRFYDERVKFDDVIRTAKNTFTKVLSIKVLGTGELVFSGPRIHKGVTQPLCNTKSDILSADETQITCLSCKRIIKQLNELED